MNRIFKVLCVCLVLACTLCPVFASAYYSYSTYTYSIDGWYMDSPDAYVPSDLVDSNDMSLTDPLKSPTDIAVDDKNNVYIADAANNRIVVLNNRLKFRYEIGEFLNDHGVEDSLKNPNGVFVNDKYVYVADTDNSRIAVFDLEGEFSHIIGAPEAKEIDVDDLYTPIAVAVDAAGRMYVVSKTTYQGVIQIGKDGAFQGFIGAQKSTLSAWDVFWRKFQTDEQRAQSERVVSTEYNNITIDEKGLIYVTTSSIDPASQQGAITGKSKSGDYAPVKKLNSSGDEIMQRTGFWPPSGEVNVYEGGSSSTTISGPSTIVDVALGPEATWSIIDTKRSKVFTYDEEGRLLFVFGDNGDQLGNFGQDKLRSMCYMGNDMLLLDQNTNSITVMKRTEYGDTLINAIKNQRDRNYDAAEQDWREILKKNNNFDAAYVGIGKAYYRQGRYTEAMEMYEAAYDTANYSTAFKYYRQNWVSQYALIVPVVIVVICLALYFFFRYAGRVNKEVAVRPGGKRTYWEEILFAFHLMMHPFDGFWDLKHEKRGSVRGAFTFCALAIAAFAYNSIGTAYLFNPQGAYLNIFAQVLAIMVPLLLWVISNWCLTTLFEGEGSVKDIFIASSYSLIPIPLLLIPSTLLTNIFTLDEAQLITMITTIMWVWVGMLIFFGSMVTHDYTMFKNVLTTIGSVVGMACIMFIALLFSSLLTKIVSFITSIVVELGYRI